MFPRKDIFILGRGGRGPGGIFVLPLSWSAWLEGYKFFHIHYLLLAAACRKCLKMPSNEEILASEPWHTTLFHKIVILILFPIYTMLSCYFLFFFLLYRYPSFRAPLLVYYAYIMFFDHQPSHGWSWWKVEWIERCRNFWVWR